MKALRRYLPAVLLLGTGGTLLWLSWLEWSLRPKPYALVEEGLYVGGFVDKPPPRTTAVLNLCGKKDSYEVDEYLWEPILEGGPLPDLAWLKMVVAFVDTHRRDGRTVYVHCRAGMNRSGAVVIAYLMQTHGWSRDRALAHIQSKRPEIHPDPTLMRLLSEWEESLRTEK